MLYISVTLVRDNIARDDVPWSSVHLFILPLAALVNTLQPFSTLMHDISSINMVLTQVEEQCTRWKNPGHRLALGTSLNTQIAR